MKRLIASVIVAILSALPFLRTLGNQFVNWDDGAYILDNAALRRPLGSFVAWAFTTFEGSTWQPLTWLSYRLDYSIWGLSPVGYHLTSLLLHAINTALVFFLALSLLRTWPARPGDSQRLWPAALIAVCFGVHPLHVESVAWAADRKDLLAATCLLSACLTYLRYCERRRILDYAASVLSFALSLAAKPAGILLPLIFIVLDWWPLQRHLDPAGRFRRRMQEKAPYLILAAGAGLVTFFAQQHGAAIRAGLEGLPARLLNACWALVFYLRQTVLPSTLVPLYPLPVRISIAMPQYWSAVALTLGLTAAAVVARRRLPALCTAWAAYVLALLPALGLVGFGQQAAADRFMYLPLLWLLLLVGWLVQAAARKYAFGRIARGAAASAVLVVILLLGAATWSQVVVWKDPVRLWSWTMDRYPQAMQPYVGRGIYLTTVGRYEEAIRDLTQAAEMATLVFRADTAELLPRLFASRAHAYQRTGRHQQAIFDFDRVMQLRPARDDYRLRRASSLLAVGRAPEAVREFQAVLSARGGRCAECQNGLASAFTSMKDYARAIAALDAAIAADPRQGGLYVNRGILLQRQGDSTGAIRDYQRAAGLGYLPAQRFLSARGLRW